MGRLIRMVPEHWEHPKDKDGHYIPLFDRFKKEEARWIEENAQWSKGLMRDFYNKGWESTEGRHLEMTYIEWTDEKPEAKDYMPDWAEEEKTHMQMYENTSEGTPLSPPMNDPEKLAQYLFDNKASAFGDMKATKEQWLATIKAGSAPSAIKENGVLISGVEATGEKKLQ